MAIEPIKWDIGVEKVKGNAHLKEQTHCQYSGNEGRNLTQITHH